MDRRVKRESLYIYKERMKECPLYLKETLKNTVENYRKNILYIKIEEYIERV
jgi:hypothetical protein